MKGCLIHVYFSLVRQSFDVPRIFFISPQQLLQKTAINASHLDKDRHTPWDMPGFIDKQINFEGGWYDMIVSGISTLSNVLGDHGGDFILFLLIGRCPHYEFSTVMMLLPQSKY